MTKKKTLLIFLIGFLLRILIMPWAMQADLISMSYRAHLMSEYGLWGMNSSQALGQYLYALNLKFLGFFFHDIKNLYPTEFGTILTNNTASVGDWLNFVNNSQVNAFIFALKIPHLLADAAVFAILANFFSKDKKRNLILCLWWFNPVNIYSFYIFSRHDSLTLLAMLLAVLFLAKEKIIGAILSLFAAIQIRFQPLLYLPIFLINIWSRFSLKKIIRHLLVVSLFISLILLIEKSLPFDQNLFNQIKNLPIQTNTYETQVQHNILLEIINKPFSLATSVGGRSTWPKLLFFTVCFALLNLFYLLLRPAKESVGKLTQLSGILYLTLALYFLINDFSPHYFVWLSLFAVLSLHIHETFLWAYLLATLGWGIMGLTATGNFAITQNLFLPISPLLFNTPPLAIVLTQAKLIFTFGHWLLRLGLLWSAYLVFRSLASNLLPPKLWSKLWRAGFFSLFFLTLTVTPAQAAKIPMLITDGIERVLLETKRPFQASFVAPEANLGALDLKFDTSRSQQTKRITLRLKKAGAETWFYENTYLVNDFYNRAFYPFGFPVIVDSAGQIFIYEVELLDEVDLPLYIYSNSYQLSREGSFRELFQLIQLDLQDKWQAQQSFWLFWLSLVGINLLAITSVLLWREKKS